MSAATDTDGFGECELDPTLEKCRQNTDTGTGAPLECAGGLTGIRLVYRILSAQSGLMYTPCAWAYPEAVRPHIESLIEMLKNGVSGFFYRDFCYSPNANGEIEKFVADFPNGGFAGFYFKKPSTLPLQILSTNIVNSDELVHMVDEAEKEESNFYYRIQLNEGVNKIMIPGGKEEDCSSYAEKETVDAPLIPLPAKPIVPMNPTTPLWKIPSMPFQINLPENPQ